MAAVAPRWVLRFVVLVGCGACGRLGFDRTDAPDAAVGYCPTVDSPVGYWRLDEPTGPLAKDASGNGNDGSYLGALTFGVPGVLPASADTAVQFSETAPGFVELGDKFGFFGTAAFSVEAWIRAERDARCLSPHRYQGAAQWRPSTDGRC